MAPTNPSAGPAHPSTSSRTIRTGNLNSRAFAPFGQVIQNPATHGGEPAELERTGANQGTATKWLGVTDLENWYGRAPSGKLARAVVNLFVCAPREVVEQYDDDDDEGKEEGRKRWVFPVRILERHPFTPQTFIPLGVSARADDKTRYLVIVAPTRGTTTTTTMPGSTPSHQPKGPREPDLANLQAFVARGDQAVTYGPGTWHAPMVVLGEREIEFVVVQYANGVGVEDCQEFHIEGEEIVVDVGEERKTSGGGASGSVKAKL